MKIFESENYSDPNVSLAANCFVLAIDAPLPYGDKTELTKKLVGQKNLNVTNQEILLSILTLCRKKRSSTF